MGLNNAAPKRTTAAFTQIVPTAHTKVFLINQKISGNARQSLQRDSNALYKDTKGLMS